MNKNTKILLFIGFIILCLYLSYDNKEGLTIDSREFFSACSRDDDTCRVSLSGRIEGTPSDDDVDDTGIVEEQPTEVPPTPGQLDQYDMYDNYKCMTTPGTIMTDPSIYISLSEALTECSGNPSCVAIDFTEPGAEGEGNPRSMRARYYLPLNLVALERAGLGSELTGTNVQVTANENENSACYVKK